MKPLIIQERFTEKATASMEIYLKEIDRISMITGAEESTLGKLIKNGDSVALDMLVKANLRFVISVAKQYSAPGIALGDLINEGNLGMLRAAKTFDESKGFKFISYAVWHVRQFIDFFINESKLIRVPINEAERLKLIKKASRKLEQELERDATIEEIGEAMELEPHKIVFTMSTSSRSASLDETWDGGPYTLLDTLPGNLESTDAETEENHSRSALNQTLFKALSELSERDKDILLLSFGIGYWKSHTFVEIGKKYKLSPERTRYFHDKALMTLKKGGAANDLALLLSEVG